MLSQSSVQDVIFTVRPTDLSGKTGNQLRDKNEGSLTLDIGRLAGDRGLEQSCLSTMDATPLWKKIVANLKRRTTAGSIDVHEKTGASGLDRNFRFTAGARALHDQGTALRQFAQMSTVFHPLPPKKR